MGISFSHVNDEFETGLNGCVECVSNDFVEEVLDVSANGAPDELLDRVLDDFLDGGPHVLDEDFRCLDFFFLAGGLLNTTFAASTEI